MLTGPPGVGKTTMIERLFSRYSYRGMKVHGIITKEVRENGQRTGFKVTDLETRESGWLARKTLSEGPRVGSYHVERRDLERIGVTALERAVTDPADLVLVDEIGPMEMTSQRFRAAVTRLLTGEQPTVATVKLGSHYPEVEAVRERCVGLEMTTENREAIYLRLIEQLSNWG